MTDDASESPTRDRRGEGPREADARVRALVEAHSPNRLWSLDDLAHAVGLSLTNAKAVVERLLTSGELDRKGNGYARPVRGEEGQ